MIIYDETNKLHMRETCPRAHPPPSPERSELKIEPPVVETAVVRVTLLKSPWYKHVWVLPVLRVPGNSPNVRDDYCPLRHMVPLDLDAIIQAYPWDERGRRVQS